MWERNKKQNFNFKKSDSIIFQSTRGCLDPSREKYRTENNRKLYNSF